MHRLPGRRPCSHCHTPAVPFSALDLALAFAIVLFAAVVQSTVGMGFNIVAVPLTLLLDSRFAPVPMIVVGLALTIPVVLRELDHVDWKGILWILLGRPPGVGVGLVLLAVASGDALNVIIGVAVLIAVIAMAFSPEIKRNRTVEFGSGVLSGALSTVSAIGGPPVGLLYKDENGPTIRATLGTVFTIGATITLIGRGLAGRIETTDWQIALFYLPAVLIGFGLSYRLNRRFVDARYRTPILVLSAGAAIALLIKSLI